MKIAITIAGQRHDITLMLGHYHALLKSRESESEFIEAFCRMFAPAIGMTEQEMLEGMEFDEFRQLVESIVGAFTEGTVEKKKGKSNRIRRSTSRT